MAAVAQPAGCRTPGRTAAKAAADPVPHMSLNLQQELGYHQARGEHKRSKSATNGNGDKAR